MAEFHVDTAAVLQREQPAVRSNVWTRWSVKHSWQHDDCWRCQYLMLMLLTSLLFTESLNYTAIVHSKNSNNAPCTCHSLCRAALLKFDSIAFTIVLILISFFSIW